MAMTRENSHSNQSGMSLLDMMIASFVLIIGVLGSAILISLSIGANNRNKQQSNSTVVAQVDMEKIMSVPANTATVFTITDCNGAVSSVRPTGAPVPRAGAPLLASGAVVFSAGALPGYSMPYMAYGTVGRQAVCDVRWNVQTLSNLVKLVAISASRQNATTDPHALPVIIRWMAGPGS